MLVLKECNVVPKLELVLSLILKLCTAVLFGLAQAGGAIKATKTQLCSQR